MSETDLEARYFRVSGTVQGVGFRAATRETASGLDLSGWVRNRSDGDVELVALGRASDLDALDRWLHDGPSPARVTHVYAEAAGPDSHDAQSAFSIR